LAIECIYLREGPDINFNVPFNCPIKLENATFFYVRSESVTERTIKNPTEEKTWNCVEKSPELYGMAQLVIRPGNNGYAGSILRYRIISKAL